MFRANNDEIIDNGGPFVINAENILNACRNSEVSQVDEVTALMLKIDRKKFQKVHVFSLEDLENQQCTWEDRCGVEVASPTSTLHAETIIMVLMIVMRILI